MWIRKRVAGLHCKAKLIKEKKRGKKKTNEQHSMRMCDAAGLDYVPTNCRRRRCFRCLRRCPLYTLEVLWFIIVNEHID